MPRGEESDDSDGWYRFNVISGTVFRCYRKFSNDDMHSQRRLGYNWNIMILPELTLDFQRRFLEEMNNKAFRGDKVLFIIRYVYV